VPIKYSKVKYQLLYFTSLDLNLLQKKPALSLTEVHSLCSHVSDLAQNSLHISWPHVLGSIETKASHTNLNQIVQVLSHLVPHVLTAQRQVRQANEPTVSHLVHVIVVLDVAAARSALEVIEVAAAVGHAREVPAAGVEAAAGRASACRRSHVVDDGVHVDAHTDGIASVDHVPEMIVFHLQKT